MKRKLLAILLAAALFMFCMPAAHASDVQPRASDYLTRYTVIASPGTSSGKIDITFSITGTGKVTSLGISQISFYKADGSFVRTVYGNTSNGLMGSSTHHSGSYTFSGTSGTSYYAVATVYAGNSGGSDSRTVTTNTAKAP